MDRGPRRAMVAAAASCVLLLALLSWASHEAKVRILHALGPRTTVAEVSLGYPSVTLRDVRIAADPAPGAWPAPDEFRATTVVVRIELASVLAWRRGEALRIADVRVEDGAISMLRTPGHVTMLPALRASARADAAAMPASGASAPGTVSLVVDHLQADALAIDLYDATLGPGAPQRLRFEQVHGTVGDIALPALDRPIALDAAGVLKGVERDGQASVQGSFTPATHDARLGLRLQGVDLIALQPWVLRLGEGGVRHGRLDLRLDATIVHRQLAAPGHLALADLQLAEDGGTFAQARRRAVLAALRRDGRIDLDFTLQGRTDDPKFSLDDSLAARLVGGVALSTTDTVKSAVTGVGGAIKGLFSGR